MKRKLALLLAGVMTMTMLPMNLFAASTNTISRQITAVSDGTVLVADANASKPATKVPITQGSGDVAYKAPGVDLRIKLSDDVAAGQSVVLTLNNAKWFFKGNAAPANTVATMLPLIDEMVSGSGVTQLQTIFPYAGNPSVSTSAVTTGAGIADLATKTTVGTDTINDTDVTAADASLFTGMPQTYAPQSGTWLKDTTDYSAANPSTAYIQNGLIAKGYLGAYVATSVNPIVSEADVPFVLAVSSANQSKATLMFPNALRAGTTIVVPVVALVDDGDKDVSVNVESTTYISGGDFPIFSATVGNTTGSSSVKTFRSSETLGTITIKESKLATLKTGGTGNYGTFKIELTEGSKFANAYLPIGANGTVNRILSGASVSFFNFAPGYNAIVYREANDADNIATVSVSGLGATQQNLGEIYLKGLQISNTDSDVLGDVYATLTNGDPGLNVTTQTFKVANRVDYGVTLSQTKSSDAIPTLVTGRVPISEDASIKLVNFTLQESAVGSWWTGRDTILTLPEGVKFRKLKATGTDIKGDDAAAFGTYLAGNSTGNIRLDGNTAKIRAGAAITPGEKAKIEFEAWVSISQEMGDQDITVSVKGGGIDEAITPAPLKVAVAMAPVTLADTEVSTIKVGLQAQATSNIIIKETTGGALKAGKDVLVKVADIYGTMATDELVFANTAKVAVTEGNIKLDTDNITVGGTTNNYANLLTRSTSVITIPVDTKSTKPSTITISNVTVKASRVLPETDKQAYKVFVFGSAVAENYGTVATNGNNYSFTNLSAAGVSTDYIKIVGGTGYVNATSAEFKYSIAEGTSTYTVNGKEFPLADDMMGYNKNGTVMVPIRLIAEGFGLEVRWNESNRTVVVDLSPTVRAEFPVGKTFMRVGGTELDMLDQNDKLVASEITNDRTYVPFRQLGYALGIPSANMVWDQATSSVTFNPTK